MVLYIVYMTRFVVRATEMVALKCFSLMKKVISAAKIRHIDGMKSDVTKGAEIRFRLITMLTLFGSGFSM